MIRQRIENKPLEGVYPVARNHHHWLRVERALFGGGEGS